MPVVDVLVDGQQRLGPLAYNAAPGMSIKPGDAVEVPFGRRQAFGVVLGISMSPERATKEVTKVFGPRADPVDLGVAALLAVRHFSPLAALVTRCAPTSAKGAPPLSAGPVTLKGSAHIPVGVSDREWRFVQRPPLVDPAILAAQLAAEMASIGCGQVLVLCPTVPLVESVLAQFVSGAARLDAAAARGSWRGFVDGQVQIGVGTRAAGLYSAQNLVGVVVVEADHVGHVAQRQPVIHAAEIARARAKAHQVPLVMTGLCPIPRFLENVRVVQAGSPADTPNVTVFSRAGRDARRAFPAPVQVVVQRAIRARKRVLVVCEPSARRRCTGCRQLWDTKAAVCSRCGGSDQRVVGWDKNRVEQFFQNKVRAVTFEELLKTRGADVVVLFDVDMPLRRATLSPLRDIALLVLAAASSSVVGGQVVCVTDTDGDSPLFSALTAADLREVGRTVWAEARAMALPPFGELVEIGVFGRKTVPDVRLFPGQVFGPRKVADGEWEWMVRCEAAQIPLVASAVESWRKRYRVRVSRL